MMILRRYKILLIAALAVIFSAAFLFLPGLRASADEGEVDGETEETPDEEPEEPEEPVFVASIDGMEYESFEEALDAWTEGRTLKLLANFKTETAIRVSESKTFDLNGKTLECTTTRVFQVESQGNLSLITNDTRGGISGGGVYVMTGASFTMGERTYITSASAENGGGVYVDSGSYFKMEHDSAISSCTAFGSGGGVYIASNGTCEINGGIISANTASNGGGIFVRYGSMFTLGGVARIASNALSDRPISNNIYFEEGQTVNFKEDFSGTVYISMAQIGLFTHDKPQRGTIEADSSFYSVVDTEEGLALIISPLSFITVEYSGPSHIFPTTNLDDLKKYVTVFGKNSNMYDPEEIEITLSGTLEIGECTITVTAKDGGGATAQATFTVKVVAPKLISAELTYKQAGTIYFDTEVSEIYDIMGFTVYGNYEDGVRRLIGRTPEETSAQPDAEYITDYFAINVYLLNHTDGKSTGLVSVKNGDETLLTTRFTVEVSKRPIDLTRIHIEDVYELLGTQKVDARRFTPYLPKGVRANVYFDGSPLLDYPSQVGVYPVEVYFEADDSEHYEVSAAPMQGKLVICAPFRAGTSNGISYEVTSEWGISPEWEFLFSDVTQETKVRLPDDLEMKQAINMTFFPGESGKTPSVFRVRILLSEDLQEVEFRLLRLKADGTTAEVAFEREGDYLIFEADELLETRFILATDSHIDLYLTFAICFGVFCMISAVAIFWYYTAKRKQDLKE